MTIEERQHQIELQELLQRNERQTNEVRIAHNRGRITEDEYLKMQADLDSSFRLFVGQAMRHYLLVWKAD